MTDEELTKILGIQPWTGNIPENHQAYANAQPIRSWLIAKDMPLGKVSSLKAEQLAKCYGIRNYFMTVKGDRPAKYRPKSVSVDIETDFSDLLSKPLEEAPPAPHVSHWNATNKNESKPILNHSIGLNDLLGVPGFESWLKDQIGVIAEPVAHKAAYEIAHEETGRIAASVAKAEVDKRIVPVEKVTVLTGLGEFHYQSNLVHREFATLLKALACRLNVMLVGTASSGKTTSGKLAADMLGLKFYHMGAVASEYKFSGYEDGTGVYHRTPLRDAVEYGGILLLDEYDASVPGATMFVQALLANGTCAFPDKIIAAHPDFRCIAACNTYGRGADRVFVGRNQQDGAALDRFVVLNWDIDEDLESHLFGDEMIDKEHSTPDTVAPLHLISTYYHNFVAAVKDQRKVFAVKALKDASGCGLQTAVNATNDFLSGESIIEKLDLSQFRDLCENIRGDSLSSASGASALPEATPELSPGEWVRYVQKIRKATTELGERHLVTMRASDYGNRLFRAGLSLPQVEAMCIWKGLPESIVNKIKHHAGV